MCEVVQNSLKAGDPQPDNSPMSELLLGIALQAAYQGRLSSRVDIAIEYQFDGAHYAR